MTVIWKKVDYSVGYLMTLESWKEDCEVGCLIDYDGWGYLCTKELQSNVQISPSSADRVVSHVDGKEITHIMWYNK